MKFLALSSLLLSVGLASAEKALPAPPTPAEAAIRKADADWVKAAQTKSVDAWMAFYSSDAVVMPPNEPVADTNAKIRKSLAGLFALPGLRGLRWMPTRVEVAKSGDLGYSFGAYQVIYNDAKGKPVLEKGKNVEIWKKQPNGAWKCIADTWNPDSAGPSPVPLKRRKIVKPAGTTPPKPARAPAPNSGQSGDPSDGSDSDSDGPPSMDGAGNGGPSGP